MFRITDLIRWYFILSLIEGIGVFFWALGLAFQAVDQVAGLLFIVPALLLSVCLVWIVFKILRDPHWTESFAQRLHATFSQDWVYWLAAGLAVSAGLFTVYFLVIGSRSVEPRTALYFSGFSPYAVWLLLLSIQTPIALRLLRFGSDLTVFKPYRNAYKPVLVVLLLVFILAGWMAWTRVGLEPDIIAWGDPGVPVLPAQVWLALAIVFSGLAVYRLGKYFRGRSSWAPGLQLPAGSIDVAICLLLWVVAVWRWQATPLNPSFFAPKPLPPNNEFYPYSDAAVYDLSAQRLLIGIGFEQDIVRPFYSLFLALAQGVSGIGYEQVIDWQLPVLATIPALLYLLGKALHHRLSGALLGLLAVFHESNAIALSGTLNVSNAKMIMSDLPLTLGVILFTLLVVYWLKKPDSPGIYPILAGGVLGLFMLIRTQIILLLPVVLFLAMLVYRKQLMRWLEYMAFFTIALVVTLAPWLWRNQQATGKITLSEASNLSQAGLIGIRYNLDPESARVRRLAGESENAFLSRMVADALQFAQEHPLETANFVAGLFLHNQVAGLMVLPVDYPALSHLDVTPENLPFWLANQSGLWKQCCSLRVYVKELPYWNGWDGILAGTSRFPVFVSLLLISTGLGIAWSRTRLVSLVPLFVNVGYTLGNAVLRNSGWRFNLPVDWVGMLYYSIGLVQICFWIGMLLSNRLIPGSVADLPAEHSPASMKRGYPWRWAFFSLLVFFMLTAAIPIAERIIPARYGDGKSLDEQGVFETAGFDIPQIEAFLRQDAAVVSIGRALYPRFYKAGQGELGGSWPSFNPQDFPRVGFYLVGPQDGGVILPVERPPVYFPNAKDVIVIGCLNEDYLAANVVIILDDDPAVISRSPQDGWSCSQP